MTCVIKLAAIFLISLFIWCCGGTVPRAIETVEERQRYDDPPTKLKITNITQFGKSEGEKSISRCAITAPIGEWEFSGIYLKQNNIIKCYGPVEMIATESDGSINFNCNGHKIYRHICYEEPDQYFINTIAGKRYLKQDFENVSIVKIMKNKMSN